MTSTPTPSPGNQAMLYWLMIGSCGKGACPGAKPRRDRPIMTSPLSLSSDRHHNSGRKSGFRLSGPTDRQNLLAGQPAVSSADLGCQLHAQGPQVVGAF